MISAMHITTVERITLVFYFRGRAVQFVMTIRMLMVTIIMEANSSLLNLPVVQQCTVLGMDGQWMSSRRHRVPVGG